MRNLLLLCFVSVLLLSLEPVNAQNTMDDVSLFQTFFKDAPIHSNPYGEGGLEFSNWDAFSKFGLGVRGGFPINPQIEINAGLQFINYNPEIGDGKSGISDITVAGRYNVLAEKTKLSAGGYITLPTGSEDIGQGDFNLGAFGALRHPLEGGIVLTGTLGLDFIETTSYGFKNNKWTKTTDYEVSLLLGAGGIYQLNKLLTLVGELNLWTKGDYMMLSGGCDYKLDMGRIRGMLGLGLDDGAPDFQITGGFLMSF